MLCQEKVSIRPDRLKIRAVKDFPIPTNVRSVREFIGLARWYCRFVPELQVHFICSHVPMFPLCGQAVVSKHLIS